MKKEQQDLIIFSIITSAEDYDRLNLKDNTELEKAKKEILDLKNMYKNCNLFEAYTKILVVKKMEAENPIFFKPIHSVFSRALCDLLK